MVLSNPIMTVLNITLLGYLRGLEVGDNFIETNMSRTRPA